MGYLFDVLLSVPIGFLYNVLVKKTAEILTVESSYDIKIQQNLLYSFIGAICAFILAYSVFKEKEIFENRALKIGMILGGIILIFNSLFMNWHLLENDVKMCFIGCLFGIIVFISYKYKKN